MVHEFAVGVHAVPVEVFDLALIVTAQGSGSWPCCRCCIHRNRRRSSWPGPARCHRTGPPFPRASAWLMNGCSTPCSRNFSLAQDQAFTRGEPDPELGQVGPLDVVAGATVKEAPSVLVDVDRLQVRAGLTDVLGQVVPPGGRDPHGLVVFKTDDFTGREVIEHDEVLDRVRVRAVIGFVTDKHQGTHQPPALGASPRSPTHDGFKQTRSRSVGGPRLGQRCDHVRVPSGTLPRTQRTRPAWNGGDTGGELGTTLIPRRGVKINNSLVRTRPRHDQPGQPHERPAHHYADPPSPAHAAQH